MHKYIWNLLFLIVSAMLSDETQPAIECDGLIFRGKYYDKHLLFESPGKASNMFLDRLSGHLLFSHTITHGQEIDFQITICHIKKRICKDVRGVPGGYAIGYDYLNDEIYLGGHQGLYKYNIDTNKANYFAEKGKSVWSIFVRRNLYYIRHPSQQLYVYKKRKFKMVPETAGFEIDNFFVTKDFEVYFSNQTGLYKAKMNKKDKRPHVLNKKIHVRQITEDIYGVVYFCARDGIYIEDKKHHRLKKIADIVEAYSMTFADRFYLSSKMKRNHLIYSDKYAIYVLIKSNNSALCSRAYRSRKNKPVKLVKIVVETS